MVLGEPRIGAPLAGTLASPLVEVRRIEIAVGHVGEGRQDERHGRALLPRSGGGPDDEGQPVLVDTGLDMKRVDAGGKAVRHVPCERRLPTAVVEIVVMEMDGAILLGRVLPVHHRSGPARTGHGAGGQVDDLAMKPVRTGVDDARGLDLPREVPRGDETPGTRSVDALEPRRLELAVVVVARGCRIAGRSEQHRAAGPARRDLAGPFRAMSGLGQRPPHQGALLDPQDARHGVVAAAHLVPIAKPERHRRLHCETIRADVPFERERAVPGQRQHHRSLGARLDRDDRLPLPGECRPDPCRDGEAGAVRGCGFFDLRERPAPDFLSVHRIGPRERGGDLLLAVSGAFGIGVGAGEPHQPGIERLRLGGADHERDPLARCDAVAVRIADHRNVRHCQRLQRRRSKRLRFL